MFHITSTYEIIKLAIEAIIIIVAGWDLVFKRNDTWYKRISKAGWILIILAVSAFVDSILKLKTENDERVKLATESEKIRKSDKQEILNGVKEAFKKQNLSYNPTTKTITIIDTSQKITNPVMDVVPDSVGFNGEFPRSIKFRVGFMCINKGIAFNIRDKIVTFFYHDNQIKIDHQTQKIVNISLKAHDNQGIAIWTGMPLPGNVSQIKGFDTTYVYFKAIYSNREIKGQDQPPLRGLYAINITDYPKSIEDLKVFAVSDQKIYKKLKLLLVKEKVW